MSRDFDARVRRLDEAPLTLDSVRGKAMTIQRNRRIAVAGGVLAAAAVVTPVAAISVSDGTGDTPPPPVATQGDGNGDADPTTTRPDWIAGTTWHQADGDQVELPEGDIRDTAIWNDRLVVQWSAPNGAAEVETEVFDADGASVDSFTALIGIAVDDDQGTLAWIDDQGTVMTAWDGGEASMGQVDLSGDMAYDVAAITGGPDCNEAADGCTVWVNRGDGVPNAYYSHGMVDNPVPGAIQYFDATDDGLVTAQTSSEDAGSCSGVYDLEAGDFVSDTCEFQLHQVSPDGASVAAPPAYFDGLGPASISIVDAATGDETGRFSPEGGFVASWDWAVDGRLVFDAYDGASWHLYAMATDGALEELADPVEGSDLDSPFTIVGH